MRQPVSQYDGNVTFASDQLPDILKRTKMTSCQTMYNEVSEITATTLTLFVLVLKLTCTKISFTVRFTNGFGSSFEIPQVRYELDNFIT